MTNENNSNYRIECKLEGNWFESPYVFRSKERAELFGKDQLQDGEVQDYRVWTTTDIVNEPLYISELSEKVNDGVV